MSKLSLLAPVAVCSLFWAALAQGAPKTSHRPDTHSPACPNATMRHQTASKGQSVRPKHTKTHQAHHSRRAFIPKKTNERTRAPRSWNAIAPDASEPALDEQGRVMLSLYALNTRERLVLRAGSDDGDFSTSDLIRAARFLRDVRTGKQHPIEPRALNNLYRIQVHFRSPEIRVVSGYRTPHRGNSNHGKGRAIDFVVAGANNEEVAAFARQFGFVGVGIYPNSGFVHLDVRDRSFFWVDNSAPGARHNVKAILGSQAASADVAARTRGERAFQPLPIATDLDREHWEDRPEGE